MSHLILYPLHIISPAPKNYYKFKSKSEDQVTGSDVCHSIFGKNGLTRHKEFKTFFSATDPIRPTPPTISHLNWKLDPCLKHMMRVSKDCVFVAENIGVDDQDIGFQDQHKDKKRISQKNMRWLPCRCAEL
mmetsp:Transcript_11562/g.11093  ORF Transcript_11562/g.11093 Transcript_11562/m.11093 type:complete len:131 (+) Transcript_11562:528-920(+)